MISKGGRIDVYDEGTLQGNVREINVVGTPLSVAVSGDRATITGIAGSGVFLVSTVEKDLGHPARRSGFFQITGLSGLTVGNGVLIQQAPGPYTGKGTLADEAAMDRVLPVGKVSATTIIDVYWSCATFVCGKFKFDYAA